MNDTITLEDILAIAKGVSEWTHNEKSNETNEYTGVYTPKGSDKRIIVHVSHTKTYELRTIFAIECKKEYYRATLKFGETNVAELTDKQAKKVYDIADKIYQAKVKSEALIELRRKEVEQNKAEEAKKRVIGEMKQVLNGDSTLYSRKNQPWCRRLFG